MRQMKRVTLFSIILSFTASGLFVLPTLVAAGEDVERVAQEFQAYCAPCHGREGRGDGAVGAGLDTKPADLTQIARHNGGIFPSEAIYAKVAGIDTMEAHRSNEMPVWGFWFVNQEVGESTSLADAKPAQERARHRISAIVAFLKTIQN